MRHADDPMKFGLFFEHQVPRPWEPGDDRRVLEEAMEEIVLADRLGFDTAWLVEHHFLEEYSHSSAPEVFLAAVAARTSRIRIGHGIVQTPPPFNHPARIAERIATLDLISNGRVDFGSGESSSEAELGAFGIDEGERERTHAVSGRAEDRLAATARDPDRRMRPLARLGHHVARGHGDEAPGVAGEGLLGETPERNPQPFLPHRLLVVGLDRERTELGFGGRLP